MTRRERDHIRTLRERRETLQGRLETTPSRTAVPAMQREREALDWALAKLAAQGFK